MRYYTGHNATTGASFGLALEVDRGWAALFFCDSYAAMPMRARWMTQPAGLGGTEDAASLQLQGAGWRAELARTADELTGTITDDAGASQDITAAVAAEGTIAGLYAVDDAGCKTGVVVVQSSTAEVPLVQGAWCDGSGMIAQVTPAAPAALRDGGLDVEVVLPGETRRLFVSPLAPDAF